MNCREKNVLPIIKTLFFLQISISSLANNIGDNEVIGFNPNNRYTIKENKPHFKTLSTYLIYKSKKILEGEASAKIFAKKYATEKITNIAAIDYLPLTGGTLTGALSGTFAQFSSITCGTNIVDDTYSHMEATTTPWGGSHALFFGAKVNYSGVGNFWDMNNNTVFAQDAGPYSYGAFSMGYLANGGLFGFYDGGTSTGAGNIVTWSPSLIINRGGNVSIGTTMNSAKLLVYGLGNLYNEQFNVKTVLELNDAGVNANMGVKFNTGTSVIRGLRISKASSDLFFERINTDGTAMPIVDLFIGSGGIGIGTTNPSEKLSVNGNIRSRKIIVTQQGWPDYVFDSPYTLAPLAQVEQFIKDNKHLPDVPSAKEVTDKGLDVGENQAVLLKKIEELTLYVIQQDKQKSEQSANIVALTTLLVEIKKQNEQLQHRVQVLENKANNKDK
ncbi:hypothetical protein ACI6Q2_08755 [Chitinophagaceae bacterium LWZ2-11]